MAVARRSLPANWPELEWCPGTHCRTSEFCIELQHDKLAKALVVLILVTSIFVVPHVFWVVTNLDFYTSLVGAIWLAGVVPFFLVVIGCFLFLSNRNGGIALILVGTALSFFGTMWSYIPFLPALATNPVGKLALIVTGNLSVLALLVWSVRKDKR